MAYLYQNTSSKDQGRNAVRVNLSVCQRHATDPAADGCNEPSECQGAGSWPAYLKGPHSERRQARTKTIGWLSATPSGRIYTRSFKQRKQKIMTMIPLSYNQNVLSMDKCSHNGQT